MNNFKVLELEAFWLKCFPVHPFISTQALCVLVMFHGRTLGEAKWALASPLDF